jgi:hypothetical protein
MRRTAHSMGLYVALACRFSVSPTLCQAIATAMTVILSDVRDFGWLNMVGCGETV